MIIELDKALFNFINSLQGNIAGLDNFFLFIIEYSRLIMGLVLLTGFVLLFINKFNSYRLGSISFKSLLGTMVTAVILVVIPIILSDTLREIILRDRPYVVFDLEPMTEQSIRPSFPQ